MPHKIRLVSATRSSEADFHAKSALGRSLALAPFWCNELRLFPNNSDGLPECYNTAIREARADPAVLVFVHDDVHITDYFWPVRVLKGLEQFQILGVIGNRRRSPKQPIWAFASIEAIEAADWDFEYLSGCVGTGVGFPPEIINYVGTPGQQVKLLDGMFLAAHSATLLDNELFFDEQFDFNLYDMDFCRQAEVKGVSMGTWPISTVHESGGNITPAWRATYARYLEKWKD